MSYFSIIENLKDYRDDIKFFESLRECSNLELLDENVEEFINEGFDDYDIEDIDEAKVVTFDGQTFPKFGHAVVMCGGSGVGKGYTRGTKIAIDAKVFDVDRLKELYIAAQEAGKVRSDVNKYDLANPDDVTALHNKIKGLGFKDKQEEAFFKSAMRDGVLPNVIYDITGDDADKLERLGAKLKAMGYKVTLVWVVTNRQIAMIQNLSRPRVVSQKVFHQVHNDVNKTVFPFLKSKAKDYDAAWITFNPNVPARTLTKEEQKELDEIGTVKLEKKGNNFVIPNEIAIMVYNILGPDEKDPDHPETYKDFGSVAVGVDLKKREGRDYELDKVKKGVDSLLKKTEK